MRLGGRNRVFPWVGLATLLAVGWGAGAAEAPVLVPGACPAAAAGVRVPLTCGTVRVPENRASLGGRTLSLAVVIAHSRAAHLAPDAVMLLTGGPSAILTSLFTSLSAPGASALLGARDLVAFDYRGIGYSTPHLGCPPDAKGNVDDDACVAGLLAAGVDLSGYTTAQVAADVDSVRRALGLRALNLWGTSYGSRVALTMARDFPADVRTLVLDGTLPLQTRLRVRWDSERADAFTGLIAACEADAACGAAFPRLRPRFEAAVARLNATPAMVDGAKLSGDALVFDLFSAQTNVGDLPLIPLIEDQAARGTLTTLGALESGSGGLSGRADDESYPLVYQTSCGDFIVPSDRPAVVELLERAPILAGIAATTDLRQRRTCRAWPYVRLSAAQRMPVVSDAPTLIFSGQYDPSLPLAEAQRAASTLSRARIVTFPGYAHVALGNGACPVVIAQQLFATRDPARVDTSCTLALPQPAWQMH